MAQLHLLVCNTGLIIPALLWGGDVEWTEVIYVTTNTWWGAIKAMSLTSVFPSGVTEHISLNSTWISSNPVPPQPQSQVTHKHVSSWKPPFHWMYVNHSSSNFTVHCFWGMSNSLSFHSAYVPPLRASLPEEASLKDLGHTALHLRSILNATNLVLWFCVISSLLIIIDFWN